MCRAPREKCCCAEQWPTLRLLRDRQTGIPEHRSLDAHFKTRFDVISKRVQPSLMLSRSPFSTCWQRFLRVDMLDDVKLPRVSVQMQSQIASEIDSSLQKRAQAA